MPIKVNNFAQAIESRSGTPYYRWKVFIDESEAKLKTIRRVIYTLHPTFPKPTQVRDDSEDKFALQTAGWGGFKILITVQYKDGGEEIVEYPLDLSKPWPKETASA